MKTFNKIGMLFLAINLAGCGPMLLKGEINDNTYTAKNSLFSINIPHENNSYEFKYMKVKEQYDINQAYISFGPAAFNQSIYRVEFTLKPSNTTKTVNIDDAAPKVIEAYKKQLFEGYGSELIKKETEKLKINNYDAYYFSFTQNVPAGKYMSNSASIFNHYAYVIDYDIGAAIIWVQVPEDSEGRKALPPLDFAKSLRIKPNK